MFSKAEQPRAAAVAAESLPVPGQEHRECEEPGPRVPKPDGHKDTLAYKSRDV